MKARRLIESAVFDPKQLKAMCKAFDDAWAEIAPEVSSRAQAIASARLKLASVVIGLAKNSALDAQQLAKASVALMRAPRDQN